MKISIFLLINFLNILTALTITDSPFQTITNCTLKDDWNLNCNHVKFVENIFNNSKYWQTEKNESYPYQMVDISHTSLTRIFVLPKSPVKILKLAHNQIQSIDRGAFQNLQNMTELDLSQNGLYSEMLNRNVFEGQYAPSPGYEPLKSMKILRLAINGLHTIHQDTFAHISMLETLDLHENPFRVLDEHTTLAISSLIYLKELDLSFTQIQKIPEHIFHGARNNLIHLYLKGNLFTKVPQQIGDAVSLEKLNLNENPITNITKEHCIPPLEKLQILHLSYMPNLTMIGEDSMHHLGELKELYMSENKQLMIIEKNVLNFIPEGSENQVWPNLKKLHLEGNQLTHLKNDFLSRWDMLDEFEVYDNPWSCDCENKWMIETLVGYMVQKKDPRLKDMKCGGPVEMEGQSILEIHNKKEDLRCLEKYGGRPERDAGIIIGVLIGLLLGIPLVLGLLFCYKRNWFGYFETGPASFSRKFYNRAADGEDVY